MYLPKTSQDKSQGSLHIDTQIGSTSHLLLTTFTIDTR
jgi:hypothetical protein